MVLTVLPSHGLHCLCWAMLTKVRPKGNGRLHRVWAAHQALWQQGLPVVLHSCRNCQGSRCKSSQFLAGREPHWPSTSRSSLSKPTLSLGYTMKAEAPSSCPGSPHGDELAFRLGRTDVLLAAGL